MLIHELWSVHVNWLYDQVNSFNWFSVFFLSVSMISMLWY